DSALRQHRAGREGVRRVHEGGAAGGRDVRVHGHCGAGGDAGDGELPGHEGGLDRGHAGADPASGLPRRRSPGEEAADSRTPLRLPPFRGRGTPGLRRRPADDGAVPRRGLGDVAAACRASADRHRAALRADLLGRVADDRGDGLHRCPAVLPGPDEAPAGRAAPRQGPLRGRGHAEGRLDDSGRHHRRCPVHRHGVVVGRRRGRAAHRGLDPAGRCAQPQVRHQRTHGRACADVRRQATASPDPAGRRASPPAPLGHRLALEDPRPGPRLPRRGVRVPGAGRGADTGPARGGRGRGQGAGLEARRRRRHAGARPLRHRSGPDRL
ncbi:MAG: predicted Co/Zn/Cd cation transporter, partial [uncultured Nocardioidaceae bacterium]